MMGDSTALGLSVIYHNKVLYTVWRTVQNPHLPHKCVDACQIPPLFQCQPGLRILSLKAVRAYCLTLVKYDFFHSYCHSKSTGFETSQTGLTLKQKRIKLINLTFHFARENGGRQIGSDFVVVPRGIFAVFMVYAFRPYNKAMLLPRIMI